MENVWRKFEEQCNEGSAISDRETKKALDRELTENDSLDWVFHHSKMFKPITQREAVKLGELVDANTFDFYNNSTSFIRKLPEATPFLIAMAIEQERTLVICKNCRDREKIKKICKDLGIPYIDVEQYLINVQSE